MTNLKLCTLNTYNINGKQIRAASMKEAFEFEYRMQVATTFIVVLHDEGREVLMAFKVPYVSQHLEDCINCYLTDELGGEALWDAYALDGTFLSSSEL